MSGKELLEKALNDENWKIKQIQECIELLISISYNVYSSIGSKSEKELSIYLTIFRKLYFLEDNKLFNEFIKFL